MSDSTNAQNPPEQMGRDEMYSALFAHMVMQQSQMAMMLLGQVPHPESGKTMQDLEGAKLFIDQLEMLEAKTNGNLSKEEANLLKQTLMSLRLAFVEAVNAAPSAPSAPTEQGTDEKKTTETAAPAPEESHKKFSKKY